jgi:hypothetical protein
MGDVLGRPLRMGDLIITNRSVQNTCYLNKGAFAIVISDTKAFNGGVFTFGNAILIENPVGRELALKEELQSKYTAITINKSKLDKEKQKEASAKRTQVLSTLDPKIGDLYEYKRDMYVYLGVCEVKFDNQEESKIGHTYMEIFNFPILNQGRAIEIEKWKDYLNKHSSISLDELAKGWLKPYYHEKLRDAQADYYLTTSSTLSVSNKFSTKFTKLSYHIDINDWDINSSKIVMTNFSSGKRTVNPLIGVIKRVK